MEKAKQNTGEIPLAVFHRDRMLCFQASSYQWLFEIFIPLPTPNPIPKYEPSTNEVRVQFYYWAPDRLGEGQRVQK